MCSSLIHRSAYLCQELLQAPHFVISNLSSSWSESKAHDGEKKPVYNHQTQEYEIESPPALEVALLNNPHGRLMGMNESRISYATEDWALKNRCLWTVVLEKTLESPLNCREIQPVHPKGAQSWIFIGRTDAEAEVHSVVLACHSPRGLKESDVT